ncbi:hypothetical protein CC86DRAFT_140799 [Ophiobolus disseminans]|uniref:Uncharacterized protein n=1 Tax=Ophiobolus disseminans TaxID=1469910 RepID=A0A6A7AE22_9PLEO|nr:hypothetical protein CC86DRAFT_140799 [Ophiobolus disseminans]
MSSYLCDAGRTRLCFVVVWTQHAIGLSVSHCVHWMTGEDHSSLSACQLKAHRLCTASGRGCDGKVLQSMHDQHATATGARAQLPCPLRPRSWMPSYMEPHPICPSDGLASALLPRCGRLEA